MKKIENVIKFDIQSAPPSEEALAEERARLAGLSNRLGYRIADKTPAWFFISCIVLTAFSSLLAVSAGVSLAAGAGEQATSVFQASLAATAFFVTALVFMGGTGGHVYEVSRRQLHLIPLDLDKCEEIVQWCAESREIAAYQTAVTQQNRMLVEGEYWAMDAWIRDAAKRSAQARQMEACETLRKPVMAS